MLLSGHLAPPPPLPPFPVLPVFHEHITSRLFVSLPPPPPACRCSRQLSIVGYANENTRKYFESRQARAVVLVLLPPVMTEEEGTSTALGEVQKIVLSDPTMGWEGHPRRGAKEKESSTGGLIFSCFFFWGGGVGSAREGTEGDRMCSLIQ